jgi:mannose-6-phosphate isomerase-like protein (cupin superfamily)
MEIRRLVRETMNRENGADAQRLVPWQVLNAPFEGAWCSVEPGGATGTHAHYEYEIFIAVSGEAVLDSQGERQPFKAGDIVHFFPHTPHRVINESDKPFEMYCVWWDTDMSDAFLGRHGETYADRESYINGRSYANSAAGSGDGNG